MIIREVTRRTGRGWLTMILLAFAFGVFQAGIVDHSLFNLSFQDIEWWDENLKPTYIPALGISANYALNFIVGHVIWSISIPILMVEMLVLDRRTTPWLGNFGLAVTIVLYLLISALLCWGIAQDEGFFPSLPQILGAAVVVVTFIVAAFVIKRPALALVDKSVPDPWWVGAMTLGLLSLVTLIELVLALVGSKTQFSISWAGTSLDAAAATFLAVQVWRWSQRKAWSFNHMLALAGGALLTRAWIAFLVEPSGDVSLQAKLIHNTFFALGVLVLVFMAARRSRKSPEPIYA